MLSSEKALGMSPNPYPLDAFYGGSMTSVETSRTRTNLLGFTLLLALTSCSIFETKEESKVNAPLVSGEYKLTEDRQKFDELRTQQAPEKKEENDEIAFMQSLFVNPTVEPSKIREKFQRAVGKKRDLFNRDMQRIREAFVKTERKSRETFNKSLETERKEFARDKHTSDQRKDFYDQLDQKRKDFYAAERLRRDDFEADFRDKRKNFDDYMREKTTEFNEQHRIYSQKFNDLKKEKKDQPGNPSPYQ